MKHKPLLPPDRQQRPQAKKSKVGGMEVGLPEVPDLEKLQLGNAEPFPVHGRRQTRYTPDWRCVTSF